MKTQNENDTDHTNTRRGTGSGNPKKDLILLPFQLVELQLNACGQIT